MQGAGGYRGLFMEYDHQLIRLAYGKKQVQRTVNESIRQFGAANGFSGFRDLVEGPSQWTILCRKVYRCCVEKLDRL